MAVGRTATAEGVQDLMAAAAGAQRTVDVGLGSYIVEWGIDLARVSVSKMIGIASALCAVAPDGTIVVVKNPPQDEPAPALAN